MSNLGFFNTFTLRMLIMKGIDTLASLFNILADRVRNKLVDDLFQVNSANFSGDDVNHLLADGLALSVLGIACFPLRVLILVGESNAENPQEVTITGLDINASFNQRLPFLDH